MANFVEKFIIKKLIKKILKKLPSCKEKGAIMVDTYGELLVEKVFEKIEQVVIEFDKKH